MYVESGMVEGSLGRRYALYLFSWIGKAHGKEARCSRWQVSDVREPRWTAERQGFEMRMVSLHGISGKEDILDSDLSQTRSVMKLDLENWRSSAVTLSFSDQKAWASRVIEHA